MYPGWTHWPHPAAPTYTPAMIRGIHGLLYSTDAAATRAFFRDLLKLPGSDVGEGWWIFDFAEGDLGVHPIESPDEKGLHNVSIYCDDIEGTVRELEARGVRFTAPIADHGYGLVTFFEAPGGVLVQLYEPRYVKSTARRTAGKRAPARKARTAAKPKAGKARKAGAKKAPPRKTKKALARKTGKTAARKTARRR